MARVYETEIVWNCTCGESGVVPLMYPDDAGGRLFLLRNTHRPARGCSFTSEVHKREASNPKR